jgi:hypothetical protein
MLLTYDFIPTNLNPNLILVEIAEEEYTKLLKSMIKEPQINLEEIINNIVLKSQSNNKEDL